MRMIAKRLPGDNPLRTVPYSRCDDAAISALEPQLFDAAKKAVYDSRFIVEGEMRPVLERDENTGLQTRSFIGPESFVKNPLYGSRPCRRVARINAPMTMGLYSAAAMTGNLTPAP
jgi:hypothetical protein